MASEKELSELRAAIRQRAGEEAAALEDQFAEKGLGFISPPPKLETKTTISGQKYRGGRGGEWDFFSGLSKAEKSRLRRNWTLPGGMQPDQFGIDDSITGQFRSVDEGVEEFLDLTRRIDVLKNYSKTGKLPSNMDAYGGLDLDSIFSGALGEIEMDMRVPVRISGLYGEDSLGYLSGLQADSAVAYGELFDDDFPTIADLKAQQVESEGLTVTKTTKPESFFNDYPFADDQPLKTQAQINREAAIARGRASKNKTGITVGTPVPQKTAKTQAQINLEAARARGMAAGPVDEAAEYALKDAAGYFDDDYFNTMSESAAYVDDVIPEYEALDGPIASIVSSAKTAGASRGASAASAVATGAPSATRASATLSSAVSKGGKSAHLNLKTAAAASALGLAGGYVANRKRTRR